MRKSIKSILDRLGLSEELTGLLSVNSLYDCLSKNNAYSHLFREGFTMCEIDNATLSILAENFRLDALRRKELLENLIHAMGDSITPLGFYINNLRVEPDIHTSLFPGKPPRDFRLAFGPISRKGRLTIKDNSIQWEEDNGKIHEVLFENIRMVTVNEIGKLKGFSEFTYVGMKKPEFHLTDWNKL